MNRREFVRRSAGGAAVLALGGLGTARAAEVIPYTREAYEAALASNEPFLLDFYASW